MGGAAAYVEVAMESPMIDVLQIEEKRKSLPLGLASADDFGCRKVGEADPEILFTDPTISLYCLDHETRRALFVGVPDGVDVTAPPFFYLAQYEQAVRLLSVPYEVFHAVAADVAVQAPLVFIHSTGRAGSTLLSKAFAEMGSVTSLSEPDVYTQAVAMRLAGGDENEIRELLASSTRILLNPAFTHGSSLNVLKFRSFCTEVGDLLHGSFPQAGNLFLYRDLAANVESAVRAFALDEGPPEAGRAVFAWLATMTPLLSRELERRPDLDPIEVPCLIWLSSVEAYGRLWRNGVPIMAVRYEELIADSRRVLEAILAYLGLPVEGVERGLRAFDRDSQAGSPLSREQAARHTALIDARRWDLVRELLRRYAIRGVDIPSASMAVQ
jgi:hypothetical protein